MRKLLLFATAIVAVFACSKELKDTEQFSAQSEAATLVFTSERPQLTSSTKTQWNGSAIVWSSGDKIRVGYTLDGAWMANDGAADFASDPKVPAKLYASNSVSIDGNNASIGTFTIPSGFTNSPSGNAVFYGVYPSTCTSEASEYAPSLTITIPSTQTPVVNESIPSFDKKADILVGKTDGISLSGSFPDTAIEMDWTRVVAHADLTFKNLAASVSSETIQNIKLTAGNNEYLTGSTYINVGTGVVTTNSKTVNTITLDGTNLTVSNNQVETWACILPVTLTSLTVDIETDAAHYVKTFSGISKQFKVNARNTLGINMSGATRNEKDVVTIADGNYVIAALSSNTYYAISSTSNNNRCGRVEMQASFDPANYSTNSPYSAADNLIWTITNVSGGVNINLAGDTDSYMQYSSGNNTLPLGDTPTTFAVSSEVQGTYRFTPATGRVIAMNGTSGFACYQTSLNGGVFDLYLIPASGTPSLTFTETSKTVSAATTAISFDYAAIFLSSDPTVTVTEDNGNAVVSSDIANSKVTITLNENTTTSNKTIKLKVAATGVDDVALTITQLGAVAPATAGDVLWSEDFSDVTGFANNTTGKAGNGSCNINNVYGAVDVTYTYSDNGTNKTLVYNNNTAGGSSAPELLIGKKANESATVWGIFTATGIPTGGFDALTLSYVANGVVTFSSTTSGVSFGSISSNGNNKTVVITNANSADFINISFENQTTGNVRIDDVVLVAGAPAAPAPGITVATNAATATATAEGTTATLNGSLTLVNGALNANVTSAGFYYKVNGSGGDYTKVTCAIAPTSTTTFSYDLTGLTTGTTYTYYAWAVYNSGSEVTGDATETTFTPTQTGGGGGGETLVYTLEPVATGTNSSPHNSYTAAATTTISSIEWSVMGNSSMVPWRIGGKSLNGEDRAIFSTTAISDNISKIVITHGAASSITVNSMTVIVSKNSDFSNPVSTLTPSFVYNDDVTVNRPDGKDWSNCYYKIVYNVSVSGTSNKFLEFTRAKFYTTN